MNPNASLTPRDSLIPIGAQAPDFVLDTQTRGQTWRLSDHIKSGQAVLSFFPFAFTGVCTAEMQCITAELDRFGDRGAQAVGISGDSGPALKAWADQLGLRQTLLSDIHRSVCRAYGLFWPELNVAWRGTVVVGPTGRVVWAQKRQIPAAFSPDELLAALA